ncbi:MKRN2 opposite strand protein-like [Branchiostoma floridae x Branchiostoma japonicum]
MAASRMQVRILCFRHDTCYPTTDILCLDVPPTCPLCSRPIQTLLDPPFAIPYPFVDGHSRPFSMVVKPTRGSFLSDYRRSDDLHVGVTNSEKVVFNFDETGVHRDTTGWEECITVRLLQDKDFELRECWDKRLNDYGLCWRPESYDEKDNNCFDFVLGFLRYVGYDYVNTEVLRSRQEFCKTMVLPQGVQAGRYIDLYRRLEREGFVVDKTL